ncbi:MAG: hypothetical protein ACO3JL_20735, partial [Myxococcota bacterium]
PGRLRMGYNDGNGYGVTARNWRHEGANYLAFGLQKSGAHILVSPSGGQPSYLGKFDWANSLSVSKLPTAGDKILLQPGQGGFYLGNGAVPVIGANLMSQNLYGTGPAVQLRGDLFTLGDARGIFADDDFIWVGDSYAGLAIFDARVPVQTSHVTTISMTGGYFHLLGIADGLAYVSDGEEEQIEVYSLLQEDHPQLGAFSLPGMGLKGVVDAVVEAGFLYLLIVQPEGAPTEILVVNASDPGNIEIDQTISLLDAQDWRSRITVSGRRVYVGGDTVQIFDTRFNPATLLAAFVPRSRSFLVQPSGPYLMSLGADVERLSKSQ